MNTSMDMLESDMKLLLESLQCSSCDADQQIEALKALAMLCIDDKNGDCIRKLNGLELIRDIFCKVTSPVLKQWSLYALSNASQNSTPNKRRLCSTNLLAKVSLLLSQREPRSLAVFAANFLLSLCSNFAPAQDLCRESGCLRKLIVLFKATIPKAIEWFDSPDCVSKNLWTTVSSTLCSMMSDPQNDSNKLHCAEVLPQAISVLKNANRDVLCSALNFIGHVINTNGKTQRMLKLVGGINSLVALLNRSHGGDDMPDEYITSLILQTISSGLTHYELNKEIAGSLGIISALIGMIKNDKMSDILQTSCLVCLSRCVDDCDFNADLLLKCNGIQTLVSTIVNATSEETRRIAILILQNSRISDKDNMSLKAEYSIMPPGKADVLPNEVRKESFQSKRNRKEDNGRIDVLRICDSNSTVNFPQNENDNAILSMLKDHRKILTNVTKHVSELKDRLQEYNDASTTSSSMISKVRQKRAGQSMASSKSIQPSISAGRSDLERTRDKHMIQLSRANLEFNEARGGDVSCRNPSVVLHSTLRKSKTKSNAGRKMNMAKCAIMNAHMKSNGSSLFAASRMGILHEKSTMYKDKKLRMSSTSSDLSSYMALQSPQIRQEEMNKTCPKSQSFGMAETYRGNAKKKFSKTGKVDKWKNENISMEGFQTENFYMKSRCNTDVKRLSRRGTKRRCQDLPTVIESVPILEQSSHEKVQGWINNSMLSGCINGSNETKSELMERCINEERYCSLEDEIENSDWENVSSMMMSDGEGRSKKPPSYSLQTDGVTTNVGYYAFQDDCEGRIQSNDGHGEPLKYQETAEMCKNIQSAGSSCTGRNDIVASSKIDKVVSSVENQLPVDESITPPSALPTRFADNHYRAKRSLAFKADIVYQSKREKNCSSADMGPEEENDSIHEASSFSQSRNVFQSGSHFNADNSDHKRNYKVSEQASSLRGGYSLKSKTVPVKNDHFKCLGCFPFARFPFIVLNKRNYIAALRKDSYTCDFHRQLIAAGIKEKNLEGNSFEQINIRRVDERGPLSIKSVQIHNCPNSKDVLKSTEDKSSTQKRAQSTSSTRQGFDECCSVATTTQFKKKKRKRQEYEDFEIENLHKGVQTFGKRWTSILNTYDFKRGRTAEDLKDKYKQLSKRSESIAASTLENGKRRDCMPFTSEETINLKIGYGRYGARWTTILNNFRFQRGRTSQDLQNKYARLRKI